MAPTGKESPALDSSAEESSSSEEIVDCTVGVGHGRNNALLTAGIIVADVVGAGILSMPVAVAKFGWMLGSVLLVILLAANVHVSILMWRVKMYCPTCEKADTYVKLATGTFQIAPAWQRKSVVLLAGFAQKSFLFGLLGLYLMSAGKGFGLLFYNFHLCLPTWALYAAALLFPFAASSRNMGSCEWLVWLNVLTLMGTVLIPLFYYAIVGTKDLAAEDSVVEPLAELTTTGVLSGLSTYTFGMTSQFMLVEIISEMRDPSELPKAYAGISAPFQLGMFLLAGLGGYCFMGNKVAGMMNESLPFGVSLQVAAACMLTHMLISYLIKGVVFCKSLHRVVDLEYSQAADNSWRSWLGWISAVMFTLLIAWVLANLVPFFGDAVDLLGASFTPLSCWAIPIALFVRYYVDAETKPKVSVGEWIVIGLEVLLSLVLMVFGTISVLQTIALDWHTYGSPFACHCEGLWKTCACSADHPGMAAECPVSSDASVMPG